MFGEMVEMVKWWIDGMVEKWNNGIVNGQW